MKPIVMGIEHSILVYKSPKEKEKYDLLRDAKEFVFFDVDKEDHAYFALYDNYAVFAFAGSNDTKDWLENFDLYPLKKDSYKKNHLNDGKWGKGTIHNGFYDNWKKFKSCVNKVVEQYKINGDDIDIYCFGHSLGGAIAELCARHLAKNIGIKNSAITFGSPRVGTKSYRDQFRSLPINGTRVVNCTDIVSTLPPKIIGFKHGCANLVWMRKSFWLRILLFHRRFSNHFKENYQKEIHKRFGNK